MKPAARRPNPGGRIARAPRLAPEARASLDHALLGVVYLARAWSAAARDAYEREVLAFEGFHEIGHTLYVFEGFLRPDLGQSEVFGHYFDARRMHAFHEALDRDAMALPAFALYARVATELEAHAAEARREGHSDAFARAEAMGAFAAYLRRGTRPAWMPSTTQLAAWGVPGRG